MPDDEPPVSAEYAIEISLAMTEDERFEFLRAWNEGNWKRVRRFLDALTA